MFELNLSLTMEQQFSLRRYEEDLKNLSTEEKDKIIMSLMKQVMVKDNLLKQFIKEEVNRSSV